MAHQVERDLRTTTGENLRTIFEESGIDPWAVSAASVKKELSEKVTAIPDGDEWRLPYMGLLLEQRQALHYGGHSEEENRLSELVNSLCIN